MRGAQVAVPCSYQEIKMSVKVSTAMKSAKTIQYIIHRTWGWWQGAGGQRSVQSPKTAESPLHHIPLAPGCPRVSSLSNYPLIPVPTPKGFTTWAPQHGTLYLHSLSIGPLEEREVSSDPSHLVKSLPPSPRPSSHPNWAKSSCSPAHTHILPDILGLHSLVGSVSWVQQSKHQPRRAARETDIE